MRPVSLRTAAEILLLAALYVGAATFGLALEPVGGFATLVWPPTGLAIAALVRRGTTLWPGIALGALTANVLAGASLPVALGIATGNTLEALAAAAMLSRWPGFDPSLERVGAVFGFTVAALTAPVVSASIGALSLLLAGAIPVASLGALWGTWWCGDAVGALTVAPFLLTWRRSESPPVGKPVEAIALAVLLLATAAFVFVEPFSSALAPFRQPYLLFPLLMWAALRFGQRGAAAAVAATAAVGVGTTLQGLGPFAREALFSGLLALQLVTGVVAATMLFVAAALAERRRAQDALAESEARLGLSLDASGVGAWDWDVASGRVTASPTFAALHGLPPVAFAGRLSDLLERIHPDDRERVVDTLSGTLEGRPADHTVQYRVVRPEGTVRWLESRGRLLLDRAGHPVRTLGVSSDVTSSKEAEETLRRHAQHLGEIGRRKDDFLAILGHELRNPLVPIVNAAEILRSEDGSQSSGAVEMIRRQAQHLRRLVDDLLDVSRITRGEVQIRRERVDLAKVASLAVEASASLVEARRHVLSVDLPDAPLWADADPVRIEQVLSNLLHNASRYTEPGGRIRVEVAREGWTACLRVRDNGAGIPTELCERIFDLFVQGPRCNGHARSGLGVGLALVRMLVEAHGGSVRVRSEGSGRGSEFEIRVPLAEAPAADAEPAAAPPAGEPTRLRILVVDDNQDAADSLALLLRRWGHDVDVAYEGHAALARVADRAPDAVVLDVGLPGLDGHEVARRLRLLPDAASVLLVALTGYGQEEDRRLSREAGFDLHLVKPVDPGELHQLLSAKGPLGVAQQG